jgi:putative hydrolase of HD superfamily
MIEERLQRQIAFLLEIDRLKRILRRTSLVGGERRENSAEHTWHISVAAMVLAEYANAPVDLLHVLKMLLVHDIVEIDAGDTFAYDVGAQGDKLQREQAAAARIFGLLPPDQCAEVQALWEEFDAATTAEARFANAVDRLLPVLHNMSNGGGTWREHNVDIAAAQRRLSPIGDGAQSLWEYVETVLAAAVAQGMIRR